MTNKASVSRVAGDTACAIAGTEVLGFPESCQRQKGKIDRDPLGLVHISAEFDRRPGYLECSYASRNCWILRWHQTLPKAPGSTQGILEPITKRVSIQWSDQECFMSPEVVKQKMVRVKKLARIASVGTYLYGPPLLWSYICIITLLTIVLPKLTTSTSSP